MKLNKEARKLARQLYKRSFRAGRLDDTAVREGVAEVIARKPRNYVNILTEYQRLLRLEMGRHHAVIECAVPLDQSEIDRVISDLKTRHGGELTTEVLVNPELIGGLRIRIGSDVWDGSVRGRLARLEQELTHA